ncbi:MAG: LEA type 2 family protein [Treponema sp.]|nr:LEA type 2 family protein [Treponema sp.]
MKKIRFLKSFLISAAALFALSCSTLKELGLSPSINFQNVAIKSLDLEGITFNCNYSIQNPYPVAFSVKQVSADVLYENSKFTSLSADKGVSVAALGSKSNAFSFKIPYNTILNFAKSTSGKKSLPFSISGNASLDLSKIPLMENQTMTLPFSKSFEVPVFKPSLSLSNPKIVLPTLSEMKNAFTSGGMTVAAASVAAASILAGNKISSNIFDNVNLNLKCNFDLKVSNSGSAAWKYLLKNCSIKTSSNASGNSSRNSSSLIELSPAAGASKEITSSSGTIPLTATLNTLKAGKFITQILNKSGENPVFTVESGLSFPKLSYAANLPLNYSKEIPLSSFKVSKN